MTTSEPLGIVAAPELVFARGAESLVGVGDANVELWVAPNPESAEVGTEANGLLEVAALDH